jgi:ACT domain-containing protein
MRSIVTVLGQDRVGIIAEISRVFYEENVNIDGINQGLIDNLFTMVMVVEMKGMDIKFERLQDRLKEVGTKLGMDIRIQKEDIFNSMHRI